MPQMWPLVQFLHKWTVKGKEHAIGYASKSLSDEQRRYIVSERECLAVVHWVKHSKPYLYGSKFGVTDHQALQWLFQMKDSSSQPDALEPETSRVRLPDHPPGRAEACQCRCD